MLTTLKPQKFITKLFLLSSLSLSLAYASSGANVDIENHCNYPVKFILGNDDLSQIQKSTTLDPNIKKSFGYLKDVSVGIGVETTNNTPLGSLIFWLHSDLWGNYLDTKNIQGKISIDTQNQKWHSINGTPSFTIYSCPSTINISQSQMLKDTQRVVIFGDSLSDKGTLHEYTEGVIPSSPPYYNGMFSNGNTWSVQFKNDLKPYNIEVSNYAVGGATAIFHLFSSPPYSLGGEYDTYRSNTIAKGWNNEDKQLVIILIGANDYLEVKPNLSENEIDQLTSGVIDQIKLTTQYLIADGIKKFVFIDLPNLAFTPESQFDEKNSAITNIISKEHNEKLMTMVKNFTDNYKNQDLKFKLIDISFLFNELINNTSTVNKAYDLVIDKNNNQKSCWLGGYTGSVNYKNTKNNKQALINQYYANISPTQINKLNSLPNNSDITSTILAANSGNLCSDPEHYIFWDRVHPTSQIHTALYAYTKDSLGIKTINS